MSNNWGLVEVQSSDSDKEMTLNTAIATIIKALTDKLSVVFASDANHTGMTNAQLIEAIYFAVTSSVSLTATRTLQIPTLKKLLVVINSTTGGQSITVKYATGTGITIANGVTRILYGDGTNVLLVV